MAVWAVDGGEGGLEEEQDCMPGNDKVADGLGLVCPYLRIDTPPFSLI